MKKKLLLYVFINICYIVSYAQSITVNPEVICAGENSYLATDTNLNYVNIGDIICVGNADHDTIIVRPEAWSMYSSEYTALSVVFYVDQTGKHGWAVKAASSYDKLKWFSANPPVQVPGLTTKTGAGRVPLTDLDGAHNTACILAMPNPNLYEAAYSTTPPFYLPAIGQIGYLYSKVLLLNPILTQLGKVELPLLSSNTWSSTGNTAGTAYQILITGAVTPLGKAAQLNVIPVMNF